MGFSTNSIAKITAVENKGNYDEVKIVISKKDKNTNKYNLVFSAKVRFVGKAHNQRPMPDQRIKILNCDTQNCYVKEDGKVQFLDVPKYVIFDYELQGQAPTTDVPELSDDDLPFNI